MCAFQIAGCTHTLTHTFFPDMQVAPYASVIVNGIYWDHRFPRLLTNAQLQALWAQVTTNITCECPDARIHASAL